MVTLPLPIGLKLLIDKEIMPILSSSKDIDSKMLYLKLTLSNTEWQHEIHKVNKKLFIFIKVDNQIYQITNNGVRRLTTIHK